MKILAIYRGKEYSPNMEDKDAEIINSVSDNLVALGHKVVKIRETELHKHLEGYQAIVSMSRKPEILQELKSQEKRGVRVFNTPESIEHCDRVSFTTMFDANEIPQPNFFVKTANQPASESANGFGDSGVWVKRGDGYSMVKEDIVFAKDVATENDAVNKILARGCSSVVVSEHAKGDLVKFYGVNSASNNPFFYWYYASEGHSKFGCENVNGKEKGYEFSEANLQEICSKAASVLGLDIYGGDCIVDENGGFKIIDFNDWPSFSKCRQDAAKSIASLVSETLHNDKQKRMNIQASIKSSDTEEWLDTVFTRPIGFMWTKFFDRFDIHPNVVTVLSIILGVASAFFFVNDADTLKGFLLNLVGVLLLMWANFYDSCDGQLARITGKKTRLGRILDGAAGDLWFIAIYIALIIRLYDQNIPFTNVKWGMWAFVMMAITGLICHARQCGLSDYYRNIHLFFLKGKEGSELDNFEQQLAKLKSMTWKDDPLGKFFQYFYVNYTHSQEQQTPNFQALLKTLKKEYGGNIPQSFRDKFRLKSLPMMKWANILTFNTRAIALYISALIDLPWLYPVFEIFVMTSLYFYMRHHHESFCKELDDELNGKG